MNTHRLLQISLSCRLLLALASSAVAQPSTVTYQGRFLENDAPVTGPAEMQFTLWDAASGGALIASNTPPTVAVTASNGLFMAALDFGPGAFPGAGRWVQVAARTGLAPFVALTPRQPITATPYAITAANLTGAVPGSGLGGTYGNAVTFNNAGNSFTGNGAGLTSLNASQLTTGTVPEARVDASIARTSQVWGLGGNAGTTPGASFLGTTDNQPLEFKVNGQRALRLEPQLGGLTVNVVGGASGNHVAPGVVGATIAGGGRSSSKLTNSVASDYATIGGGYVNTIASNSFGAVISGGGFNRIEINSPYAVIAGGQNNLISSNASHAFIAGGTNNSIAAGAQFGFIGGGRGNRVQNQWAVAMGNSTTASGNYSIAMGSGTVASGVASTAMGWSSTASGVASTAMGIVTTASGVASTAMGSGTVASGEGSTATGNDTTASGQNSTSMGNTTTASGYSSTAMGRRALANNRGSFVWADSQNADFASTADNQFSIRASGGVRLSDDTSALSFGNTGRQMLNLWGTTHAIGVQANTTYFRTGTRFSWYRGGTFSNTENSPGTGGTVAMTLTSSGLTVNGTFISSSDRNVKQDFQPVDSLAVLDKVVALPLSEWTYQADEERSRHVGPMAQDFRAAFGLGADDKHIATVDADGVALAAIQGLNRKVEVQRAAMEQKETEITELQRQNAELLRRLEAIEQRLK